MSTREDKESYKPRYARRYHQIQFLRDHFLASDPSLTANKLREKIAKFMERELTAEELDLLTY